MFILFLARGPHPEMLRELLSPLHSDITPNGQGTIWEAED